MQSQYWQSLPAIIASAIVAALTYLVVKVIRHRLYYKDLVRF